MLLSTRIAIATMLMVGAWLFAGSVRAEARPRQDVIEYGGVTAAGSKATKSTAPSVTGRASADDDFKPGDVVDWIKDNKIPVIIGVGILLLVGTWKAVT